MLLKAVEWRESVQELVYMSPMVVLSFEFTTLGQPVLSVTASQFRDLNCWLTENLWWLCLAKSMAVCVYSVA